MIRGHKRLTVKERPLPQRAQPFHRRHSQMSLRITVFHFLFVDSNTFLLIFVLATFFAAFGDEQVQEVTCLYSALLTRCTRNEDTLDKLFLDRRVSKYVCFFSSPFISMTHTLLESLNSKNLVGKSITREMSHFVSIFTSEPSPRNWGPFDHRGCQFLWLLSFSPGALLLFGNCGLLHESVDEGEGRPLVAK